MTVTALRSGVLTCLAALAVLAPALSGCSPAATGDNQISATASGAPEAQGGSRFIILTPPPGNDQSFISDAVAATQEAAAQQGATAEVVGSANSAAVQEAVNVAVAERPALIVGFGEDLLGAFDQASASNLDQDFLIIGAESLEPTNNLTSVVFRTEETDFLAGIAASALAQDPSEIGVLVARDTDYFRGYLAPFLAGVEEGGLDATQVSVEFGDSADATEDQASAERALDRVRANGADILATVGLSRAVTLDGTAASEAFRSFGRDSDSCTPGGTVIDSAVINVDAVLAEVLPGIAAGEPGGVISMGLADGGLSLASLETGASSGCLAATDPAALSALRDAADAIVSGDLTVPNPLTAS